MTDREYLEIYDRNPFFAQPYFGQEDDKKAIINYNKELCKEYPFLKPKDRATGLVNESYNYTFTELDDMPNGWRLAFGIQICEEIKQALIKADYLEDYQILQIKEKYGTLRWYSNGAPQEVYDIISKYEHLSYLTCVKCGNKAEYISRGWICPFCGECVDRLGLEVDKISDKE